MPGGLVDTGNSEALARGMGMGLHAASLRNTLLYREAALEARQRQLGDTERMMQMRGENWDRINQIRAERADLESQRLSLAHGRFQFEQDNANRAADDRARGLDLRERTIIGHEDAARAGGETLYGELDPSWFGMGPPSESESLQHDRFVQSSPEDQRAIFHQKMSERNKQAIVDAEHQKAQDVKQKIAGLSELSAEQKEAAMTAIDAKAAKVGIPSWIGAALFPHAAKQQGSAGERAMGAADDKTLDWIIRSAQDNPYAFPALMPVQAMNEKKRRATPGGTRPSPAPGSSLSPPPPAGVPASAGGLPPAPVAGPTGAPAAGASPEAAIIEDIERTIPPAADPTGQLRAAEYRRRKGSM